MGKGEKSQRARGLVGSSPERERKLLGREELGRGMMTSLGFHSGSCGLCV